MKRFHVHLSVPDLAASVGFYSRLFGAEPAVVKPDYAKWMLDDPRVNFAISQRGRDGTGLDHLGLQADSENELAGIRVQFEAADARSTVAQTDAHCCYAVSNKHWVQDPQGIRWEAFHTLGDSPLHDDASRSGTHAGDACCKPTAAAAAGRQAKAESGVACCGPSAAPRKATISGCCGN
ncbi:MAG TPA: ArsI/CadI family heavy metal resistance metalloenzyme [Casimicrobiaceae bacterium]